MISIYKKQSETLKKCLKIEKIISIRFSSRKTFAFNKFRDTACTALARSLRSDILTYIDRKSGQLCPGGNYFLNITHPSTKEICAVYVEDEKVFANDLICSNFIKKLPKYQAVAKKRYILFTPLVKENNKPDVVLFLANPAQTGRILGLSVYKKMSYPSVMPALPTCASLYAPIEGNKIHINFIDYFDRYHQGKQNGRSLWKDSNLIISMPFGIFEEIIKYIPMSAHGNYKPKIKPQKIDPIVNHRRAEHALNTGK